MTKNEMTVTRVVTAGGSEHAEVTGVGYSAAHGDVVNNDASSSNLRRLAEVG